MIYQNLSKRQNIAMTWWNRPRFRDYGGIICDGAIRSGKTVSMAVGFVLWSMSSFDNQNFAICGKTIASLRRNVIMLMPQLLGGIVEITERRSDNMLIIRAGDKTNRYYLFGGRDESSYMLVQGITLAGVLFDEVALMPRSFVDQSMARCSVEGSKLWFNCNPEGPAHWFYMEWVCQAKRHNMMHLHFTMDDNPSLSDNKKAEYESRYTGVFYDRYIRGLWVKAEGRVYPMFERAKHVISDVPKLNVCAYFVSIDYGTVNPCSMGLWRVDGFGKKAIRIKEYYFDARVEKRQHTDEEYYSELEVLTGVLPIRYIVVDPSAASFIECIRRHGKYRVLPAVNDVEDGIRVVASMLDNGMIQIHESCKDSIREFAMYSWDEKAVGEDKVIKEFDHAMDDIRYFCNTVLRRDFRWADWRR